MADLDEAISHHQAGRFDAAEAIYRDILRSAPEDADALHLLGLVILDNGDSANAVALIEEAIALQPGIAPFHNTLGNALKSQGDLDRACLCFRRALALDPNLTGVHVNLGDALWAQGNLEEAEEEFRAVPVTDLQHFETLRRLGKSYTRLGKYEDAYICLQRALGINPDSPQVYINLGNLRSLMGEHDEAKSLYLRALDLDPGNPYAKTNLAYQALLTGDFTQGWYFYKARPSARNHSQKLWQDALPKDLTGKHLLIIKDQGLGDHIFFLRFAPELFRRGARITYVTNPKLTPILAPLPFLDEIVDQAETNPGADYTLLCTDLPLACGMTSPEQIPPPYPIPIDNQRQSKMSQRLKGLGSPPYIGITWRAGSQDKIENFFKLDYRIESLFKLSPLDRIADVLRPVNGTVLALQRLPEVGEIDQLAEYIGRPVHDFTALNDDLEDMLALLSLIDEYVCVSNTNVHVRAGAGRTSRVLVPTPPEWRWMVEGDESPWFPGTSIYRQGSDQSWDEAFSRLGHDLIEALGTREQSL